MCISFKFFNSLLYNTFNLYSKNQTIGILDETNTLFNKTTGSYIPCLLLINSNNITLTSPNTIGIKTTNITNQIVYNNIITEGNNNTPMYIENNVLTQIGSNNFTSNTNTQNIFKNITQLEFNNNNITVENQKNLPLITIENTKTASINYNYLKTEDLRGNTAVKTINVTNITMVLNRPGIQITNENYNQYFTNQTLNSDIDTIELGSNLYNKNMTFNHQVQIENPNNYTIYNGTIIFTENATSSTMTGLNIHNTDDRQTSLEIYSKVGITNNTIYQKNTNNPAKTIIIDNTQISTFSSNKITTIGKNVTIINLNNLKSATLVSSNIFNGKGLNITAIEVTNSKTATTTMILSNTIILESENPITAVRFINSKGARLMNSIVIVKTKNYDTPIVEIINATTNVVSNNYIESEDVYGNNAVKKSGTGTATIGNNKPTTGNYKTQINITLPSEIKIGKTYTITINVTSMMDEPLNGTLTVTTDDNETILTLTDGIATYNYTPTKDGETTINITYTDSEGKYEKNTLIQTVTVNKINTILKVDSVKGIPNTRINIPITLTDEDGNPLNGTVTVIDQYNNTIAIVNVIDGKGTFTKLFRGNLNENLTFIYNGNNIYNAINTTINIDIHKLSTTVTIDPINAQVGDKIIIKATVTDEDGNPVTAGKIVFKVNGKTLRDAEGNIIYAYLVNGVATIENYTVPINWYKSKATINVVYGGTSTYKQTKTNNTTPMNITKRSATMTLTPSTTTPKQGETLTLTAKITDKNTTVNTGHVIFKVNGKTMKNNNGQVLYHDVINGTVTLNYTIPANASPKDYTFTCVYGNTLYERCDVNSTITVVKS